MIKLADLDRLLWRCEFGYASPSLLHDMLLEELRRIGDDATTCRKRALIVRRWDGAILEQLDSALSAALRGIDEANPRAALDALKAARRHLAEMIELIDAHDHLDKAKTAIAELKLKIACERLIKLPTVASLDKLMVVSSDYMGGRQWRQACYVAGLGCRFALTLMAVATGDDARREDFEQRVRAVEAICMATSKFVDEASSDVSRDGTAPRLRALFRKGRVHLAVRLLSELEVMLRARRRFRDEVENGPQLFGASEEIARVVVEHSWSGALEFYWQRAVASHAATIGKDEIRLRVIAEAFEQLANPQAPAAGNDR